MWTVVTMIVNTTVWTCYLQNIQSPGKTIAQLLPAFNEGTIVVTVHDSNC